MPPAFVATAFRAFVRRSDDRRLERVFGRPRAQRAVFGAMARSLDPAGAGDFRGEIAYELRRDGVPRRAWTVAIADGVAVVRPGRATPVLTIKIGVPDLLRIAAGELEPSAALLDGRMDLEGDFAVAMRLGEMFPAPTR